CSTGKRRCLCRWRYGNSKGLLLTLLLSKDVKTERGMHGMQEAQYYSRNWWKPVESSRTNSVDPSPPRHLRGSGASMYKLSCSRVAAPTEVDWSMHVSAQITGIQREIDKFCELAIGVGADRTPRDTARSATAAARNGTTGRVRCDCGSHFTCVIILYVIELK
ncbi:hypothetical protein JYU34_013744, partial [Plutella xylostella]